MGHIYDSADPKYQRQTRRYKKQRGRIRQSCEKLNDNWSQGVILIKIKGQGLASAPAMVVG